MNPLFLNLILFVCLSSPAICEDNSQGDQKQEGETILVTHKSKDQSEKTEEPNSADSERDRDMLGLLAGIIQSEITSDDALNSSIGENKSL